MISLRLVTIAMGMIWGSVAGVGVAQDLPEDVDSSGVVDVADVQRVVEFALGYPVSYPCDVNQDGEVTIVDVQRTVHVLLAAAIPEKTPVYTYKIVHSYPHDSKAFTQGLVYDGGEFLEGTGLYGESSLRRVQLETGEVTQKTVLGIRYFGEGIALVNDRIIQLTWRNEVAFVYDATSFSQQKEFKYPGEGWGLTYDGARLIMSDGSDTLRFLNPDTFSQAGSVKVYDEKGPVAKLNELEYIKGEVYANVWQTNRIARISPATGRVTGWIDLTGILNGVPLTGHVDVLNGIAYDSDGGRLFVTGKLWPKVFEIELVPVP